MLAACLIALPLVVSSRAADDAAGDSDRPLVLRIHSLAGLTESLGRPDASLSLLPYRVATSQSSPERSEDSFAGILPPEDVCALVRETIDPQLWDEQPGTMLDLRGPDQLVVVAPQETQEAIADFLGRLGAALVPTEVLEVSVLPADAADADRNEVALDAAEADRRIAERGLLHRARVALRDRAIVESAATERQTIVWDWDIEIAQGATIADPIVDVVETGLRLLASTTRVDGGLLANVIVRTAGEMGATADRRVQAKSLVNAKPVMSERIACGVFQHPRLAFAAFAATLFLPEGKAVWVPVTVATHRGEVALCLDLRVTGRIGPAHATIDTPAQPDREALRTDFFSRGPIGLGSVATEPIRETLFSELWTQGGTAAMWARLDSGGDDGYLASFAERVAAEVLENGIGSVSETSTALRTALPKSFADRVTAALAQIERIESNLLVRGRILAGDDVRASFRVPVVVGRPLALWAGMQGTRLADWDVDVANEAQSCNPEPEAWVDGFALRLEVKRGARGELVLLANAKVSQLQGDPEPVELQDDSRLTIDRVRARTLFVDELRTLPAQGGKALFGGDLSLELEVIVPAAR